MHVVHLAEALDPTRFRTRLITGRITGTLRIVTGRSTPAARGPVLVAPPGRERLTGGRVDREGWAGVR